MFLVVAADRSRQPSDKTLGPRPAPTRHLRDAILRQARLDWACNRSSVTGYRQQLPTIERSIAWLIGPKNRSCQLRCRRTSKNNPVAAPADGRPQPPPGDPSGACSPSPTRLGHPRSRLNNRHGLATGHDDLTASAAVRKLAYTGRATTLPALRGLAHRPRRRPCRRPSRLETPSVQHSHRPSAALLSRRRSGREQSRR